MFLVECLAHILAAWLGLIGWKVIQPLVAPRS